MAVAHAKALLLAMDVLFIIWGAFLLYRVADEAGAVEVISRSLPQLFRDRGMQALLIGWPFASFLQGVGGFGVPVAVTAPLLIGLGFGPIQAMVIPSLGHAWSVTFGSLGSSFQALIGSTGVPGEQLAPAAAGLLGVAAFGCGIMAAHAAGSRAAILRLAGPLLLIGAVMAGVQYWLATHRLWQLAGFGGSLAGHYGSNQQKRTRQPQDRGLAAGGMRGQDPAAEGRYSQQRGRSRSQLFARNSGCPDQGLERRTQRAEGDRPGMPHRRNDHGRNRSESETDQQRRGDRNRNTKAAHPLQE